MDGYIEVRAGRNIQLKNSRNYFIFFVFVFILFYFLKLQFKAPCRSRLHPECPGTVKVH